MHHTQDPSPFLSSSLRAAALGVVALLVGASACATPLGSEGDFEARSWDDASHEAEAIIAMIEEASDVWTRACPEPGTHGLCVRFDPAQDDPNQCDRPVLGQAVVHPRDSEAASRAQRMFERALEEAEHLERPQDPVLLVDYRRALGQARLALADADIETYFEITMPTDLDFRIESHKAQSTDPAERTEHAAQVERSQTSREAFTGYFDAKVASSGALMADLARVKETADPRAMVQAALRTAWISGHFADELRSATIPESLRALPTASAAYCAALSDHTDVPVRMALDAARFCRERADELGYAGPEVDACGDVIAAFSHATMGDAPTQRSAASGG